MDVGVMPLFFGEFTDFVGELKGVTEILELVGSFEMVTVDNIPDLGVDLGEILLVLRFIERFVI
jgi:hypothetical protein